MIHKRHYKIYYLKENKIRLKISGIWSNKIILSAFCGLSNSKKFCGQAEIFIFWKFMTFMSFIYFVRTLLYGVLSINQWFTNETNFISWYSIKTFLILSDKHVHKKSLEFYHYWTNAKIQIFVRGTHLDMSPSSSLS